MKRPKNRNQPIDARRYRGWVNTFSSFRHDIPEGRIRDWIGQFNAQHQDLAARILDCVDFFTHEQISGAFRAVLEGLPGWHRNSTHRTGRWRFVAYSKSAGESGDSMLHKFRHANNLAGRQYDELFILRSEILSQRLGSDDTVVLIDDFAGTGQQACDAWNDQFGELLSEVGRVILVVVAAPTTAVDRVKDEAVGLELLPHHLLSESDNVFSTDCKYFNSKERSALLTYCKRSDSKDPKGRGDCGLLVVFAHTCPNDSIPILHKSSSRWEGLFRRYN